MAKSNRNAVAIPCIGYQEMEIDWDLIRNLLGGTKAMRAAREKWLPSEPSEELNAYNTRLNRSFLYNGYRDTLSKLSNRPFSKPIQITDFPEEIEYLKEDTDGIGTSFEDLAKSALKDLINYGKSHIFIDHSELKEVVEGRVLNKDDEERLGARVLLNVIHPPDLIGWQTEIRDKQTVLTQIRIKETVTESVGEFGDEDVNYIRLYTETGWERWKEVEVKTGNNVEKVWRREEEGIHSFGKISLVTIYSNKIGFMMAEPALMDLAWLNLTHWQSYSDQRNILRLSRFGLLFGAGFPKEMVGQTLPVGPAKAYLLTDPSATLKYVEHTGASIAAGARDIEDIEIKMEILGQQPLMRSSPLSTATAKRIDESRNVSQLQSWVKSLEKGLMQVVDMACQWRKIEKPETTKIDVFSDFEISIYGSTDKELLAKIRTEGDITRERLLRELQRRGVFTGDMDPQEEAKLIEDEEINELKRIVELEDDEEDV